MSHKHTSHHAISNRLKRTLGHLKSVLEMIEAGRPCVDLAQQLHAVEQAVANAKRELIHDHIDHCLGDGPTDHDTLTELKRLTKYL